MSNIEYLKENQDNFTILCTDTRNGERCVVGTIREDLYNAEDMAVKLYICREDNDDGHLDRIIGEKEFNENFTDFKLDSL